MLTVFSLLCRLLNDLSQQDASVHEYETCSKTFTERDRYSETHARTWIRTSNLSNVRYQDWKHVDGDGKLLTRVV